MARMLALFLAAATLPRTAAPDSAAIASLYLVPVAGLFVAGFAYAFLRVRSARVIFAIAVLVALFTFLAWLSRSCSVTEVPFPPRGMPGPFAPEILLDPIEVATGAAIPAALILIAYPVVIKPAGLVGMVVCGALLVALMVAEWYVLRQYILPHYLGCG